VIIDGRWMSGVIDRLLVERDDSGRVRSATVIDFKTDRVEREDDLIERYSGQMLAYRMALAMVFEIEAAAIDCALVSTALKRLVKICAE
jgi:ATP-dependent helicase/nuclease subunit A